MEYVARSATGGRLFAGLTGLSVRCAPVLVGLVVFGFSLAGVDGFLGVPGIWHRPAVVAACALCGVVAGLARVRLWPLFVAAPFAMVGLMLWPAAVVAAFHAGSRLRGRPLLLFVLAALGTFAVSVVVNVQAGGYREFWAGPANAVVQLVVFLGLPLVLGLWLAARRQLLAELRERADRLEREQTAHTEAARSGERARIAREMHDVLAHRVSLMVLHAGAIEVHAADGRLAEEAALIRSTGRAALSDLREVLGVLRAGSGGTDPQPVLADLDALIAASRSAGVPVGRRVEGAPVPLPDTVQRTAYRVVQEALTNVHRHAGRADTEVILRYAPGRVTVSVRNAPPPEPVEPPVTSGYGLAGLRERVALLGGRCAAGPDPDGGFTVRADLPVAGTAPPPTRTEPTPEALPREVGPPEARPRDAGPPDAGPPEARPCDAGPSDAGPPETRSPEAGSFGVGPPGGALPTREIGLPTSRAAV
ncbi:MAG TPA: histidine kinase [Actinocatenispora sp.]